MVTAVVIREANAEDVAAILGIYRDAGLEYDSAFTVQEAALHLERFRAYPNYRVFVALLDGVVVGTYALLIMDNLAKRGRRSGVVEDVGVAPVSQGKGIGRAMMQHAIEQCRQADCYKLALSSNQQRGGAHEFYEALGFERHGYSFVVPLE